MSTLESITADLNFETRLKVLNLVGSVGLLEAGRILGYDVTHYDNLIAAGRILMHHHQQTAPQTFMEYVNQMRHMFHSQFLTYVDENQDLIEAAIQSQKHLEFDCDWFSANTNYKTYLLKPTFDSKPLETVTYANMRIAIQLHWQSGWFAVESCFQELCQNYYTPASPTIFNAGKRKPQMSSCFLMTIGDNLEEILYTGVADAGMISSKQGGLGMDISRVRHSEVSGAGNSQGTIPMAVLYNSMVRYVDQAGLRKGAATLYNRPHHIDIFEFCNLVDKIGDQYERAHDINTAIWFPDIFWKRVAEDGDWTLFCPAKTPQLNDVYGLEFEKRYIEAENDPTISDKNKKVVKAMKLFDAIVRLQRGAGMPYVMHADACNLKSNQRHLGYIRCSNLCLEILEHSSEKEIASCNLSSLSLRHFVRYSLEKNRSKQRESKLSLTELFDFPLLGRMTRSVVVNLNRVIDNNWCPLDKFNPDGTVRKPGKIRHSNYKHRPIGLGVSGLAEALYQMDLCFEDPETRVLNKMIFACMYFQALLESVQLAILEGPYESFPGSPFSEGKLQFDLWAEEFKIRGPNKVRSEEEDQPLSPSEWEQNSSPLFNEAGEVIDTVQPTWEDLKRVIMKYGTRNSLLLALMPTATTAQKLRNAESVEAPLSNLYSRKVMNGAYPVINRYLIDDLQALGLWNDGTVEFLKASSGSVKNLETYVHQVFPDFTDYSRLQRVVQKYKTMWELSQKLFLQLAADRGRYIDQSQSTNIYLADPTDNQLKALHMMTYMLGLKTGMYYLRTLPAVEPIKFTVDPAIQKYVTVSIDTVGICTKEMKEAGCPSCQ